MTHTRYFLYHRTLKLLRFALQRTFKMRTGITVKNLISF